MTASPQGTLDRRSGQVRRWRTPLPGTRAGRVRPPTVPRMGLPAGETALVVVADAAEPLVALGRQRYEDLGPLGVPAHVTLLYPFLPLAEVTDGVCGRIEEIVGA